MHGWRSQGPIGGVVTPFAVDGTIDWDSFEAHLDAMASTRLNGLLLNAAMGEGGHLTAAERRETLEFAIRQVGARVPVLATIYGTDTDHAAAEARDAARRGASGLLIYPHPAFGGHPLDPELPAHYFDACWSAAGLPMIVFRTPGELAPTFDWPVLRRLTRVPGVVAVKDSVADLSFYEGEASCLLAEDAPLAVLIDHDPSLLTFRARGAMGATIMSAVVNTQRYVELFEQADADLAAALHEGLRPFEDAVLRAPFRDLRARLKHALFLEGTIAHDGVRRPLPPLSVEEREDISRALATTRVP